MTTTHHPAVPTTVSATLDDNGRLWVVSPHDDRIWLRKSDDFGKSFSAETPVNPAKEKIAADGDNRPKIIVTRSGDIYVSYTKVLEKPYTGDIRVLHSSDGGKTFASPVTVNDNHEIISHRFEAMQANDKGQLWLAWLDKRDVAQAARDHKAYVGAALYYAESGSKGERFKANVKLADHSCECCRVAMTLDTDGMPVIFWRHVFDNNIRDHAMLKLDGKSSLIRVSEDNWQIEACPHHGPSISISTDGVYHFVWFTGANDQARLIYRHTTDRGAHFSKPVSFGDPEAQAGHPDVLSFGKNVTIVWKSFDGKATAIYAMRSSDGGQTWSNAEKIAATSDASDYPMLIGYQGKAFLSWYTTREGYRLIPLNKMQSD
ncbi:MAG: sialidase family protein [Pseudomonadota bacterium]